MDGDDAVTDPTLPDPTLPDPTLPERIEALLPDGPGHQFVVYGDACSGIPGAPNEAAFARTNEVVRRLSPGPELVVFTGDEIVGLTVSEAELRAQWRHWLDSEMAWLDRSRTPLYNTTSNHTTYDEMSERVFAEALPHLPRNGPPGQAGLSYAVRHDDLLLVAVNTCWSGLGGEGHVETEWLATTLAEHADARHAFVVGHHPVFAVNGFSGEHQREIGRSSADAFWDVLVDHGVVAYLCSHILAFDVQVVRGVLQIVTGGAATPHRMPPDVEYLHAVQAAVDGDGLRYQVIDQTGVIRERLAWPPALPPSDEWRLHQSGAGSIISIGPDPGYGDDAVIAWRITGTADGASVVRARRCSLRCLPRPAAVPPARGSHRCGSGSPAPTGG